MTKLSQRNLDATLLKVQKTLQRPELLVRTPDPDTSSIIRCHSNKSPAICCKVSSFVIPLCLFFFFFWLQGSRLPSVTRYRLQRLRYLVTKTMCNNLQPPKKYKKPMCLSAQSMASNPQTGQAKRFWFLGLGELFITRTCTCNERKHKRLMESVHN